MSGCTGGMSGVVFSVTSLSVFRIGSGAVIGGWVRVSALILGCSLGGSIGGGGTVSGTL